jgi:tetratricopeptide (TPR) repeat protein
MTDEQRSQTDGSASQNGNLFLVGPLVLLLALQAFVSPDDVFRSAEELYRDGRFAEAAEQYEVLISQGIEDGTLCYNLGNAYFKSGQLGLAILHYERALRLMPGDRDTKANLEFANTLIADVVERPDLPSYVAWVVDLYRSLEPGTCAGLLSLMFLAGGGAISILILGRWPRLRVPAIYTLVIAGFFALVGAGVLAGKLYSASGTVDAIVLVPSSDVRSGPGETNPQLTEIHAGLKVSILGSREGWYQISLPNGLTGWVREDQVEVI